MSPNLINTIGQDIKISTLETRRLRTINGERVESLLLGHPVSCALTDRRIYDSSQMS